MEGEEWEGRDADAGSQNTRKSANTGHRLASIMGLLACGRGLWAADLVTTVLKTSYQHS